MCILKLKSQLLYVVRKPGIFKVKDKYLKYHCSNVASETGKEACEVFMIACAVTKMLGNILCDGRF